MPRLIAAAALVAVLAACAPKGPGKDLAAHERGVAAAVQAAEGRTGVPVAWRTNQGAAGSVTPLAEAYTDAGGRTCRTLRQESSMAARTLDRDLTACKAADGTWELVNKGE